MDLSGQHWTIIGTEFEEKRSTGVVAVNETALDNGPFFGYIVAILLIEDFSRGCLREWGRSGSRGRNDTLRSRAASGQRPAGITTGLRLSRWTGTGGGG